MLHDVCLYGNLGDKYGKIHKFDIVDAPQAIRALSVNFKGFLEDFKDGLYQVVIGNSQDKGTYITEENVKFRIGENKSIHITPVIKGSGKGAGKVIAGVVLIVIGVVLNVYTGVSGTPLIQIGIAMAFSGIASLLTPSPNIAGYDERDSPDKRASFLFNGPTNRGAEGSAVPLVYGQVRTGSVVVSAGIQVEQVEIPEVL